MQSVTQPPATRERLNELVAELFGDPPAPGPQVPASLSTAGQRWQQAVTQVGELLRAKLRVESCQSACARRSSWWVPTR